MAKQKQSELQKAADRVRIMQEAVDKMESNMQVCLREYAKYDLLRDEASRNLEDTRALLNAQHDKLHREIGSVRKLVGASPNWGENQLTAECAKRQY